MTWTVSASGTQAATIGSEITLTTDTTNGTYYFEVDTVNLVLGDAVELRMYVQTLGGGALRVAWKHTVGPTLPPTVIFPSPSQPSNVSLRVTLKQTLGTARNFDWKLLRV